MTAKVDVQAKADSEFYKPLIFTPSVPPPPGAPKGRCDGRCRKTPCVGTGVSVNQELKPNTLEHSPKAEQHALNSEPRQPGGRSTVLSSTSQKELIREEIPEQEDTVRANSTASINGAQSTELTPKELDAILMEDSPGIVEQEKILESESHVSPFEAQYMEFTSEELDAILMEDTPGSEFIDSDMNEKKDHDYIPRKSSTCLF